MDLACFDALGQSACTIDVNVDGVGLIFNVDTQIEVTITISEAAFQWTSYAQR